MRGPGVEPGSPRWQRDILPINHPRMLYFNSLKFDDAIKPIPMIRITILVDEGMRSKNKKVAEVKHKTNPIINKIMLIFLAFFILNIKNKN